MNERALLTSLKGNSTSTERVMQPENPTGLRCTVAIAAAKTAPGSDGFIAVAALSRSALTFALILARSSAPDALQVAARAIAGSIGSGANSASP
jgi:hypothetical protein